VTSANNTTEKKTNIAVRLLAFLLTLALVLGAVAAVAYRDKLNLDALKRWYRYRSLAKSDSGQAEQFFYEGHADDLFADLDGDLLVCTPSAVRIYSTGGVAYLEDTGKMEHPVLASGGGVSAAYDVGGRELRVFDRRSKVFSLSLEEGKRILSAVPGESGFLTVITKESGCKGVATVYDASYRAILSLRLSSRFLMDGAVTADGKSLAVLTAGQADGTFESSLLFYPLGEGQEPHAVCSLGSNVVFRLDADQAGLWALGDAGLSVFSHTGALTGQYDYYDRHLKNASLDGGGFAALMLGKYRAGSASELVTVDAEGQVLGSLALSEQVFSLSASGRYVAVLTAGRLDIYTKDLALYHTLEDTRGARSAVMRSDGSVILIGGETARLYLPL